MKTFVQHGRTMSANAPYAVVSGAAALLGSIVGVAQTDVANGVEGEWDLEGVFDLAKATGQAWSFGAKIYWDNTAKNFTTTSAGNTLAGVAAKRLGEIAGATTGWVRLNGVPG